MTVLSEILGDLGILGACALFLAPVPTMLRIHRSSSTLSFSPDPYLFSVINCLFWVVYALPWVTPDRLQPLITNVIGVTINGAYVGVFAANNPGGNFWKKVIALALIAAVVLIFTFLVAPSHPSIVGFSSTKSSSSIESEILGATAVVFNTVMYSGPLTIISTVISTKSVEFMPLLLTVGASMCSLTWLGYGLIVKDWNIIIPNGLGALFAVAQIVLYCTYMNTPESIVARERLLRNGDLRKGSRDDDPLLNTPGTRPGSGV